MAVIGWLTFRQLERRLVASAGEGLALAAADIADKLDLFLYERFGDVQMLANAGTFLTREPATMAAHLAKMRSTYQVYAVLEIVDASGTVIAAADPINLGRSRRETEWFAAVQRNPTVFVSEARTAEDGHREGTVQFAVRLAGPPYEFTGAAMIATGLPAMDALFENTVHAFQLASDTHARFDWQILTRDGRALHDSLGNGAPAVNLKKLSQPSTVALTQERIGWIQETHPNRAVPVVTGFAQTRGYREFAGLGWSVLVRVDRAKVFASMRTVLWPLALGVALIVLPLVGFIVWSTRQLHMDWIKAVQSEEQLVTTLRSIGDGVIATDPAGCVTLINPVAEYLTGWSQAEARGRPLGEVLHVIESDTRLPLENPFSRVLREDTTVALADPRLLIARDGTERAIADSGAPIRSDSGAISGVVLVLRDVSDRELQEKALRASQEMFRLITDHVSDLIAVVDLQGRQLYTSRSYGRLLGRSGSLYKTESFADVHPDDRLRVREIFAETVRTGRGQRAEYRLLRTDGGSVEIESIGSVIRNQRGQPDKVLVVSRDISERRQGEERLRREKEFTDTLISSLPGIFYLRGRAPQLLRWNKNLETVTGYSAEEIARMDSIDFFHEAGRALVRERAEVAFTTGKAEIETFLQHTGGNQVAYYINGLRLEIDGKPHLLGIGIDISARKTAEDALHATMARLARQIAALAEQAHSPALRGDNLAASYRAITEIAARTLGVSRVGIWFYNDARTVMRCADLYVHPTGQHESGLELSASDYPLYFAALAEGRVIPAHSARDHPHTREFAGEYLRTLGITSMLDAPIRSEGQLVGVVCHEHTGSPREWSLDEQSFAGSMADLVALSMEVWQRRQAEAALREARDGLEIKVAERTRDLAEANERLQEVDRLKSEFLATMSHELRTPLNSIIGFTGILRQGLAGPLNDEQKKQLGMVHFSAKHLLGLINDLLDLSRIESGKMEVFPERFRISEVIDEVVQTLAPGAAQKSLALEVDLGEPEGEMVCDRKKFFQIVLNLANNAVKFTEHGSVKIQVRGTREAVTVSVIDTGIGIKAESLANLFQAFRQVDGSARRAYEGTGLGLYLCRQLTTLLGGVIDVQSEFGSGSCFRFTLPRELRPRP
jgi:PAS domain S-box-containing protein